MKNIVLFAFFWGASLLEAQPFYEIASLPVVGQNGIQFTDENNGFWWGSDTKPLLLRTTNKGLSWDTLSVPGIPMGSPGKIMSAYFFNADVGVVATYNFSNSLKAIYKTYNKGITWALKTNIMLPLGKIVFRAGLGYALTGALSYIEVHKTNDFGETWTNLFYSSPGAGFGALQDAYITNSGDFIGVTSGGDILKYNASGGWQVQYSNSDITFNKVFFINDQNGYAVGSKNTGCISFPNAPPALCGYLLKTTNGGVVWDTLTRLEMPALAIRGISADTIFIGQNNKILYSNNGGITRQIMANTNFGNELTEILVTSKKINYVCDGTSLYYKYPKDSLTIGIKSPRKSFSSLSIFPNPSSDIFNIAVPNCTGCMVSISLYNTYGQLAKNCIGSETMLQQNGELSLDANQIEPGIYTIQVRIDDQLLCSKLIKTPN